MTNMDLHEFINICDTVDTNITVRSSETHNKPAPAKKKKEKKHVVATSTDTETTVLTTNVIKEAHVSRRKQHHATTQALKEETHRAAYMATYHAKPFELDRRNQAIHPTIPVSRDSLHLFTIHGGVDSHDAEPQNPSCPFTACHVHPRLVHAMTTNEKCGLLLKTPTIIQQFAWNHILQGFPFSTSTQSKGRHYFIQSETGSGKTLAYLVPILQSIALQRQASTSHSILDRQHLQAIILCPTRELTVQTGALVHILSLHSFAWIISGALSGGEKRKTEKALLRRGVHILIATPGRFLDHLHKTSNLLLSLQKHALKWLVLDETDRLLMDGMSGGGGGGGEGGLQKQVQEIVQMIRHQHSYSWQNILVSATISDRVQSLAKTVLTSSSSSEQEWVWCSPSTMKDHCAEPIMHAKSPLSTIHTINNNNNIKSCEHLEEDRLTEATPQQLTQLFMVVSAKLRLPALIAFLATRISRGERIVVFMATCDSVDYFSCLFQTFPCILKDSSNDGGSESKGIFGDSCPIYRLHGNVVHHERQQIVKKFSEMKPTLLTGNKTSPAIMFCTDVAARGLNFPSIDWIVQFDPAGETSDYVHRVGRAARAGKAGHALLFLLPTEQQYIDILKKRGLINMSALSLSNTLESASKLCPGVTSEGVRRSGGSSSRKGESFANAIQNQLEEWIVEDDRLFKETRIADAAKVASSMDKRSQKRKEKRQAQISVGPFLEKARKAYFAYIQSYPTREKALKHIFSPRALHLGHVARSFALKEAPSSISKAIRTKFKADEQVTAIDDSINSKKRNSRLAFEVEDVVAVKTRNFKKHKS